MRALPWRTVVEEGVVLPYGSDALYHLRRALYTALRFPSSLDFDRYIHYPEGGRPIWTPVFDWTLGLLLRPLANAADPTPFERAAVWVPPLLGAGAVLALHRVGRRHFGAAAGGLAALTLSVLSAHFWYSQVGFIDHHAAVALCAVALLGSAMSFAEGRGGAGAVLGFGVALGLPLAIWPGSLLHVGLAEAACGLRVVSEPDRRRAGRLAGRLAAAHAVAVGLLLPLALAADPSGPFSGSSPLVLGAFQPAWLAVFGLWAAGCAGLWRLDVAGGAVARRVAVASALGLGLAGLAWLALPGLPAGAGDAWRWLGRGEVFQARVAESQPLLWNDGGPSLAVAWTRLSGFFLLFPVMWIGALRTRERPAADALRVLAIWSLGLLATTLLQRRFFNSFAPALALLAGWAGARLWRARVAQGRRRAGRAAVFVGLWLALLAPTLVSYAPYLRNEWRVARGEALEVSARRLQTRVLLETAHWLRLRTRPTRGWLDPSLQPEYGVLGPWDAGHAIEYTGRRPTVVDNFGDDLGPEGFARAARYFRSAEPEALEIAAGLRVRYVVVGPSFDFGGPRPAPGSAFRALGQRDGAAGDGEPAWTRHRLVYESRPGGGGGPREPSLYKVYELVPGALILGLAPPGAEVELGLALRSNRLRTFRYRAATRADADGRYRLRVPYPTGGVPGTVRGGAAYRLRCAGERDGVAQLGVPEEAVLTGAEVEGPALCGVDARGAL